MNTPGYEELLTPSKTYWILSGDSKAFDMKDEIKAWGGYYVREHSSWCIDNPSEDVIKILKCLGLVVQFRRYF